MLNRKFSHKVLWGLVLVIPLLKSWKTAILLSIIIPVGLLTAFKLTSVIKSAVPVETVTLNSVNWDFPRPTQYYDFGNRVPANYSSSEFSLNTNLIIGVYDTPSFVGDSSSMSMGLFIGATETNPNGFVQSVDIQLHEEPQGSPIDWLPTMLVPENLSLQSVNSGFSDAYASLTDPNRTRNTSFSATILWEFFTQGNVTYHMQATDEITYYNGTAFKKMIQPFDLTLDAALHILKAETGIESPTQFLEYAKNVTVTVNSVAHQTPFTIFVTEGSYEISFPKTIQVNSTAYQFDRLTINNELDIGIPDLTRDIQGDTFFTAYYEAS